jgi:hypothetical protein
MLAAELIREIADNEIIDCATGTLWDGLTREDLRVIIPPPMVVYAREEHEVYELKVSRRRPIRDAHLQLSLRRRKRTRFILTNRNQEITDATCQEWMDLEIEDGEKLERRGMPENPWPHAPEHAVEFGLNGIEAFDRIAEERGGRVVYPATVRVGDHWHPTSCRTVGELRRELEGLINWDATYTENGHLMRDDEIIVPGTTILTNVGAPSGRDKITIKLNDGVNPAVEVEIHENPKPQEWHSIIRDLRQARKISVGENVQLRRGDEIIGWESPLTDQEEIFVDTRNRRFTPKTDSAWSIPTD